MDLVDYIDHKLLWAWNTKGLYLENKTGQSDVYFRRVVQHLPDYAMKQIYGSVVLCFGVLGSSFGFTDLKGFWGEVGLLGVSDGVTNASETAKHSGKYQPPP